MKKIGYLILLLLVLVAPVSADTTTAKSYLEIFEDVVKKVPATYQGAFYNFVDNKFDYAAYIELASYKNIQLTAGYLVSNDLELKNNAILAGLNYNVGGLKDLGIDLPVLNLVDLNVGLSVAGFNLDKGNDKVKCRLGATCSIIKVKF